MVELPWTELPRLVERAALRWGLAIHEPLEGGSLGRVFGCTGPNGEDLVLKLSPPMANPALEARALAHWNGHGVPGLVAWDEDDGALLVERVRPGTFLMERDRSRPDDQLAIRAAAGALAAMQAVPPPADGTFPSFSERLDWWLEYMKLYSEPAAVGTSMLPLFERVARSLDTSAKRKTLVHGDFLAKNLLLTTGGGYVAVDPLPFIGEPASDIGQFTAYHSPVVTVIPRASAIAEATGLDPHRAAVWSALWMVAQATETWREDSDDIQAWVVGDECQALVRPWR